MKIETFFIVAIFISIVFIFSSCAQRIYRVAYPTLTDGKYDSEFPYKSGSTELLKIAETIRKITSIAYYKSYIFTKENPVVYSDLKNGAFLQKSVKETVYNNSVIGTGTVLYFRENRVLLLTCAHVVDFPDTTITYFRNPETGITNFIQSISIKQRQNNFVAEFPERGLLEILAIDKSMDLAILGKQFEKSTPVYIKTFEYPLGSASELEWGSFVYLLGFPKGYRMITKGIVSQPNRDKNHGFLIDALFNHGFSGGIVLAIRDGVPNFELVGIATSVSANFKYSLKPSPDIDQTSFDPRVPYKGEIYVDTEKQINYGITFMHSPLKKFKNISVKLFV